MATEVHRERGHQQEPQQGRDLRPVQPRSQLQVERRGQDPLIRQPKALPHLPQLALQPEEELRLQQGRQLLLPHDPPQRHLRDQLLLHLLLHPRVILPPLLHPVERVRPTPGHPRLQGQVVADIREEPVAVVAEAGDIDLSVFNARIK